MVKCNKPHVHLIIVLLGVLVSFGCSPRGLQGDGNDPASSSRGRPLPPTGGVGPSQADDERPPTAPKFSSAYSQTLAATVATNLSFSNAGLPVTSCSVEPALPAGLSIEVHEGTCRITGTPTSPYVGIDHTITAKAADGSEARFTVTIEVKLPSPPNIADGDAQVFVTSLAAVPLNFVNTGSPAIACTIFPVLPPGLSLEVHEDSCRITGTPTAAQASTMHSVTATSEDGSTDSATIDITVIAANPPILSDAAAQNYVTTLAISDLVFDNAGGNVSSCEISPDLTDGLTLDVHSNSCRISGTPTVAQAATMHTVVATASDGTLGSAEVSITVVAAEPPSLEDIEAPEEFILDDERSFAFVNTGGAVVSCEISPELPSGLDIEVYSGSCQIIGTPAETATLTMYTVTAEAGDGSVDTATVSLVVIGNELECPSGYIAVPAYSDADTGSVPTFCVMKYEAKNDGSNNPVSIPQGLPWNLITHSEALSRCQGINVSGYAFDMISNVQWQSIARQIERYELGGDFINWQGRSIDGENSLNRGNSVSGNSILAADSDDANGCLGTATPINCGNSWHLNKRTHALPNDEVIWDLAGNAWEWIKEGSTFNYDTFGQWPLIPSGAGNACSTSGCIEPWGKAKETFGPYGSYTKSSSPFGALGVGNTDFSYAGNLLRGGTIGAAAGVFAIAPDGGPSDSADNIGFRCVALPAS